nr:hypothetical protein [Kibdelosporangium sp. MJ126-NF4]
MTTRRHEPAQAQTEHTGAADKQDNRRTTRKPTMPDEEFEPTIVRGRE